MQYSYEKTKNNDTFISPLYKSELYKSDPKRKVCVSN